MHSLTLLRTHAALSPDNVPVDYVLLCSWLLVFSIASWVLLETTVVEKR